MARTVTSLAPPGTALTLSNQGWGMLMKLAHDAGWKPMGCQPPPEWSPIDEQGNVRRWFSMDYFSRKGQQVLPADAAAIADAIESALPDVPQFDALGLKIVTQIDLPSMDKPLRAIRQGAKVNPFEYFSGHNRDSLVNFIEFCRAGGFTIS